MGIILALNPLGCCVELKVTQVKCFSQCCLISVSQRQQVSEEDERENSSNVQEQE